MINTHSQLKLRIGAALVAVLMVSFLALRVSAAAFSDTTTNPGNDFAAGDVVLVDNDGGVAMFSASNMKPGDTVTGCIEVTYQGSLDAEVHLYAALNSGTLADYLDLDIVRGDGTCAALGTTTTVWSNGTDGDLGVFLGSATDYASGVDNWAPTGGAPDDTVPYEFTITLQDNNAAQGLTANVDFTWEAQNT